jgi:recombination protein RecT
VNTENKEVAQPAPQVPAKLSDELSVARPEIEKVLPAHVSADRFMRVVMTAVAQNPALRSADRASLLTSAIKAATDGLLPDGREGAFVIFKSKVKERGEGNRVVERWVDKVQWMPMVAGILKKIRNSGKLISITANVVYQSDEFRFWIDDAGEHVQHQPASFALDRGGVIGAYAMSRTKDGGTYIEVMSLAQINQVRAVSRAANDGPWVNWFDEMARKTVVRRLAKRLPISTDVEVMFEHDNETYDLRPVRDVREVTGGNEAVRHLLGVDSAGEEEPAAEPEGEQ